MMSSKQYSPPTAEEHTRFLASFLFSGEMYPALRDCVRRAYLDFSRTAHGINRPGVAKTLRSSGHELAERLLAEATQATEPWCQEEFDEWHHHACAELVAHFREHGYSTMYSGQAQKWINMAVKYALTLQAIGMLNVEHAASLRQVAHVPVDNYIVDALKAFGVKPPSDLRSRIADYDEYMAYQKRLRARFSGWALLDVEFHEWNAESRKRRLPPEVAR